MAKQVCPQSVAHYISVSGYHMNGTKAKIGDIIVPINPLHNDIFGVECIVVDLDTCPFMCNDLSECIWATVNKKNHGGAFWLKHDDYKIMKRTIVTHLSETCPDCKGTGKITLLNSVVDCDCKKRQTCQECSYEYCECDGKCNKNYSGPCSRCEVLVCEACLVDGMCHNCFAKLQGGVI